MRCESYFVTKSKVIFTKRRRHGPDNSKQIIFVSLCPSSKKQIKSTIKLINDNAVISVNVTLAIGISVMVIKKLKGLLKGTFRSTGYLFL